MRDGAAWATTAAVAVVLFGCSGDTASRPTAQVADSAGVRIVAYDLTDVAVATYAILGESDLEIGELDGADGYQFSRVIDVRTTDDGSIIVADGGTSDIRVYDVYGGYLRTLGQRGEGPGEFATGPLIAGLAGDTVFAWDSRSRRVTSFLRNGAFIATTTLQAEAIGPLHVIRLDDGTYLSQSRWVSRGTEVVRPHDIRVELDSVVVERVDATGTLIDTLRVLADMERARMRTVLSDGRVGMQMMDRPLTPQAFTRSDGVRPIIGHNGAFELVSYGRGDTAHAILRVEGAWPAVSAEDIRSRLEARLVEASEDGEPDPRTLRVYQEFMPDRIPGFSNVIISGDYNIWIASYEFDLSNGFEWLVFSSAWELRGSVHTPPGLRVFEIRSGFVVGVVLDDFDVPYVRRYPLARSGEGAGE